jgi:hypothetical protein
MASITLPISQLDQAYGVDLLLDGSKDLSLDTYEPDLAAVVGPKSVATSLRRRLTTTPQGFTRMVKTVDGYRAVDEGYGSILMSFLSAPITSQFLDAIVEEAEKTALQDLRIASTQGNIVGVDMSEVKLQLYSTVEPEPIGQVITGEFDLNGLPVGTVNTNYQFVLPLGGLS